MFMPAHCAAEKSAVPRGSTFTASDWQVLASYWHPVARTSEVTDKPISVQLLDVALVLFRLKDGIKAAADKCPHRGAMMSRGMVRDDLLVCGFHGFHFNGTGECVRIPSIAAGSAIPKRIRLDSYLCQERYGLVWVCLADEPRAPLPEWRPIEDGSGTVVEIESYYIDASAGRRTENFNDVAHVPFVHVGTFGGPEGIIAPYEVEVTERTLSFSTPIVEQVRYTGPGSGESTYRNAVYSYELTLPFASSAKVLNPATGDVYRIYDVVSPWSCHRSRVFQFVVDQSRKMPVEALREFTLRINDEDTPQVEGQSPYELPLYMMDEIHIPADRMSIEYRRALSRMGLGAGSAVAPAPAAS